MLQIAVEDISSASIIDEVRDFVTGAKLDADGQAKRKSQCEGIMMGVNQSMEKINANSKWVARDAAALRAWAAKGN